MLAEGDIAFRAARGNFGLVWVQGKGTDFPPYAQWTWRSAQSWPELDAEMRAITGDPNDRDSPAYLDNLRDPEYEGLLDTARENLMLGISVLVVGPLSREIRVFRHLIFRTTSCLSSNSLSSMASTICLRTRPCFSWASVAKTTWTLSWILVLSGICMTTAIRKAICLRTCCGCRHSRTCLPVSIRSNTAS